MDGSALEHSDSDSGESWTLLDNGPGLADDAPDFAERPVSQEGVPADNAEKDEDTDGISIISDSEPESPAPCELAYDKCLEESRPSDPQLTDFISVTPVPPNIHEKHGSIRDDEDFLGDNNGKLKTYVHKRNKRLSTMLNIIVLGSVITAAGVAIGHMWGARHDCSLNSVPSVNKILSNLYKLQEENAFLRNRVKELTLVNNFQQLQRNAEKAKHKCKKVFEESLTNTNADKFTKCVDERENLLDNNMLEFEKEFLDDIEKLRNVYHENKSWLDEEIAKRMKREGQYVNKLKINNLKSPKSIRINEEIKTLKDGRVKGQSAAEPPLNTEEIINVTEPLTPQTLQIVEGKKGTTPEKKITYADSLKSVHKVVKRDTNNFNFDKGNSMKDYIKRRKPPKEFDTISERSSDEELRKDDRYVPHVYKPEKKKNDRHKTLKKQKRRNKYEQWEMKGGYMKDYDDFSIPSSHENEFVLKNADKNFLSKEFERNNYINQFSDAETKKPEAVEETKGDNRNGKEAKGPNPDPDWYEQRVALRKAARRRLEHELFARSPSSAQWYFRRVQRRELCRNNHTRKRRHTLRDNYKTKH